MNDTGPDAVPPPARCSRDERSTERFVPVPEPNLNSIPSVLASSRIDSIRSSTELMKHADACCDRPGTPMLNQTGLLKDACSRGGGGFVRRVRPPFGCDVGSVSAQQSEPPLFRGGAPSGTPPAAQAGRKGPQEHARHRCPRAPSMTRPAYNAGRPESSPE